MIREISINDLETILALDKQVLGSNWTEEDYHFEILNKDSLCLLIEEDFEIKAFLIFRKTYLDAELLQIAVAPKFQRQKFASVLLNEAIKILNKLEVEDLHLEVSESNDGALKFYEKHGFVSMGIRKNYYGNGKNAIRMRKRLFYVDFSD